MFSVTHIVKMVSSNRHRHRRLRSSSNRRIEFEVSFLCTLFMLLNYFVNEYWLNYIVILIKHFAIHKIFKSTLCRINIDFNEEKPDDLKKISTIQFWWETIHVEWQVVKALFLKDFIIVSSLNLFLGINLHTKVITKKYTVEVNRMTGKHYI